MPALLGGLALWLLATVGLRPLLLPDEGRYAEVARGIAAGHHGLPLLNGLPFFHKPPLFYWLDAVAMQLTGATAYAARFGSVFGAWLMGASLLLAMRRWHGDAAARLALAVLAKGLIGIVLPGLVVVPWLVARGRWRQVVRLMHPAAVLAFALVAGPWFVSMQLSHPEFFDYFVIEQHFRRFAQSNFNNVHGFWFFFAVVPLLTLPWSMWLPLAAGHAWRTRGTPCGLYGWWVIVVLGFFSLPDSKLVGYALPALAPWCALLALAMGPWVHRFGSGLVLAAAATCVGIVVAAAWWAPGSNRELAQALAGRKGPHDRVVMVDEYLYDVPFYARLPDPVLVASDWADPQLPAHDNWRKELFDAARFDPVRGRELLIPLNALAGVTCTAPAVWFVVPAGREAAVAALSGSQRAFSNAHQALWRVPGRSCP